MARGRRHKRVLLALDWSTHELERGIARYAGQAGWIVDRGVYYLREYPRLTNWDGVLVWLLRGDTPAVTALRRARRPVVSLRPGFAGWPTVTPDNRAIAQLAADYFWKKGYRHFLFAALHDSGAFRERREAFQAALRERGGDAAVVTWQRARAETVRVGFSRHVIAHLRRAPKPLAVFAPNDPTALMALDACLAAGLAVPQQVAVLGVDNDAIFNELAPVPLSSVDPNNFHWGWEAAALLDRLMAGQSLATPELLVPPTGLVTRRSTDMLAIEHEGVARALQFIHAHYREPIHIQDVAAQAFLSRRQVQADFKRHVGVTIFEEITRLRLDHACRLLRTTDWKTNVIAAETGLGCAEHLAKVFRRHLQTTPSAYRQKFSTG